MAWETKSRYFSGQGVVLMGDTDADGNPTGLLPIGNVSKLALAVEVTTLEHKESQTGQRGIDLRLTTDMKVSVSMDMESYIAENIALGLRAGVSKKVAGTVTDEPGKVYLGYIMPLKHAKVSSVVIKDTETTPNTLVPYVAGMAAGTWDYKLNADAGSIQWAVAPVTVSILDEEPVTIAYSYSAQQHIEPLTVSAPEKFLRFEGLNTAEDNNPVVVEIFRYSPDPIRELSLIGDGIGSFTIESSALMDTRRTGAGESKFFRQIVVGAAS